MLKNASYFSSQNRSAAVDFQKEKMPVSQDTLFHY